MFYKRRQAQGRGRGDSIRLKKNRRHCGRKTHHLVLRLEHSEQLVEALCEMRKTSAASALVGIVPGEFAR
jgi:hypothetical protein